jgi:hypothetical protein
MERYGVFRKVGTQSLEACAEGSMIVTIYAYDHKEQKSTGATLTFNIEDILVFHENKVMDAYLLFIKGVAGPISVYKDDYPELKKLYESLHEDKPVIIGEQRMAPIIQKLQGGLVQ